MNQPVMNSITAPQGFSAAGVKAGIKISGKRDIAVIYSQQPAVVAGVFTQNAFCAAPVTVSKQVVSGGKAQAIVVNSGNANACTGTQGLQDARDMADYAGQLLNIPNGQVVVASTGIIGVALPVDKVKPGIAQAVHSLTKGSDQDVLEAIMTTDTLPKTAVERIRLAGIEVTVAGIAKGSGMIEPNMATMLGFITTDAKIDHDLLQQSLKAAVDRSFNCVTVDGDTSTNDMVIALANGMAAHPPLQRQDADYQLFAEALERVCIQLAKMVAKDGEGATKLLEITVQGAADDCDAKTAAKAVANSNLVKTAFFGQDPNWGRILCAVGYSGAHVNPDAASLHIGGVQIVANGQPLTVDAEQLKKVMQQPEITVTVDLHQGSGQATVWTCDFSYDYVKINGEYHT